MLAVDWELALVLSWLKELEPEPGLELVLEQELSLAQAQGLERG